MSKEREPASGGPETTEGHNRGPRANGNRTVPGTVVDPSGAAVPNAAITVKSVTTGSVRKTTTSMSGAYTVTNLLPGEYTVSAKAAGFAVVQEKVTVAVGARAGLDLHLQVGQASTLVEVAAAAVQVNTETQTLSLTITGAQLNDLPTLNANPYELVGLSGNVSDAGAGGRGAGYSINGQREWAQHPARWRREQQRIHR